MKHRLDWRPVSVSRRGQKQGQSVANHLEDLTAEWLEFNGYFVRKSDPVGKRDQGGWEGELDVVAVHPAGCSQQLGLPRR